MASNKNYLIGRAEVLTELTPPPKMNPGGNELYTMKEVINRLQPQMQETVSSVSQLSEEVCPRDYAVTKLTLHPSYISKGHFPKKLLREMGGRSIGSKGTAIKPDKWTRKGEPEESPTTSIFVAGKRSQLSEFSSRLTSFNDDTPGADDLRRIWSIETVDPQDKIKQGIGVERDGYFEAGVQLIPGTSSDFIKKSFCSYAASQGFEVVEDLSITVSNIWFVPLAGAKERLESLACHSFVRVLRPIPQLRAFRPLVRASGITSKVILPNEPPVANDVHVAILDGGLPEKSGLSPWVNNYVKSDPSANDCDGGTEHGLGVTSAFLFGPLKPNQEAAKPFSYVDHHRVLDSFIGSEDPYELYRTLGHIEDILLSRQYEFLNLSLGPSLAVDDDEIHSWTSLIDEYLADGETFMTVAAGNNGEADSEFGLDRIQVPSDSVNAVAVGSATSTREDWERAAYSAVGPGRAPGRVKPDMLAFGGSHDEYFHVLSSSADDEVVPQQGTSFASPYALRKAVGIRALMGHQISAVALKALLVNSSDSNGYDETEVGWGKAPDNIESLIESPEGVARILYQGELLPGKYLKVPLPMPDGGITGKVKVKATCCFATQVDPQDSSMYTKAGVEISWCPKEGKKKESFFKQEKRATEAELRRDAAKWETTLHAELPKTGRGLDKPYFELHYMARDGGGTIGGTKAPTIKYAFVVTLEAPKHKTIFTDILSAYTDVLTEIKPRVNIPARISV
ncbi:S8 family peptidase [Vibrio fluvialis]|uniref:S8 family peptidase n=1 Tax=Vibrio fluvialis TaxID=676 RepID=UPI001F1EEF40|nr:S8 family peptidase [Vibrio fluvialis]MCE7586627.1 S8 family peptidase [Vibrio fluvialis]